MPKGEPTSEVCPNAGVLTPIPAVCPNAGVLTPTGREVELKAIAEARSSGCNAPSAGAGAVAGGITASLKALSGLLEPRAALGSAEGALYSASMTSSVAPGQMTMRVAWVRDGRKSIRTGSCEWIPAAGRRSTGAKSASQCSTHVVVSASSSRMLGSSALPLPLGMAPSWAACTSSMVPVRSMALSSSTNAPKSNTPAPAREAAGAAAGALTEPPPPSLGVVNAPEPMLGAYGPNWRRRQRSSDGSSASTGSERRGALSESVVLSESVALVGAVLSIAMGDDEDTVVGAWAPSVGAWAPSAGSCGRLVAVRVPPSCSRRRVTTLTTAPK